MTYIRRKLKAEKRNHGHYGDANDGSKKKSKDSQNIFRDGKQVQIHFSLDHKSAEHLGKQWYWEQTNPPLFSQRR